ncbi:MAG: ribonuclease G [Gammaproteobacteria bacterium]|nr:ribonuclease G [Gammaproteobacteria bacterium]MDH3468546.1 ribonuclease G [Gammaproteobacteria bacterium]
MSEEVLINVTPQETRVAVVENGALQEVHIERTRNRGIVGNIYIGKVVRVLPGMQAAFVDAGLERTAFLHAGDIVSGDINDEGGLNNSLSIHELLHDGQRLAVQVVKDPLGSKGARLTTEITIPARNLVYLPFSDHVGVSQKIQDPEQRERLKGTISAANKDDDGGFIIRTAAESATAAELLADIKFLKKIWARIQARIDSGAEYGLIHEDIALPMRTMRDLVSENIEKVRIDSREMFQKVEAFARDLIPEVADRIEYYPGERPIFDLYSVEDEIERALQKNVPLKSGGYLVIDQTEAMTTIDVNTGGYVGRRNLADTLFKTNLEAAQMLARQLRLRNIGGIIIVDFIDMEDPEHRRQVRRALDKGLARDRTKTLVTEMSPLGLVEITRKRARESLEHLLTEPCGVCGGRGVLKTPQTVCYEVFREILREARQFDAKEYVVLASQVVIDLLLDEESAGLSGLQAFIGKPIRLQVESTYQQEIYDVVLI